MEATFTKLRSGDWGCRVQGSEPQSGSQVTVSRKDGTKVPKVIGKVIWSGGGVHLCTFDEAQTGDSRPPLGDQIRRKQHSGYRGRCRECGGPIVHARHHQAMDGLCGSCAFDEFDM